MDTYSHTESPNDDSQNTESISLSLPGDVAEQLKKLAEKQSITLDEALRRAVSTETFFHDRKEEGFTLFLMSPEDAYRLANPPTIPG